MEFFVIFSFYFFRFFQEPGPRKDSLNPNLHLELEVVGILEFPSKKKMINFKAIEKVMSITFVKRNNKVTNMRNLAK